MRVQPPRSGAGQSLDRKHADCFGCLHIVMFSKRACNMPRACDMQCREGGGQLACYDPVDTP